MRASKRFARFLPVLPALLLAAAPLAAQAPPPPQGSPMKDMPRFFGVFTPTVGAWAEYAVTEIEGGKKSTMRNSIVGKEGDGYWYEVAITEPGGRNIVKMFVKGDPNSPDNIQRLILKSGDQPAQEMPRDFVLMGRRMAMSMFETRSGVVLVGQAEYKTDESGPAPVTVAAGTFSAMHKRVLDQEGKVLATADISADVPPLGVVRSETEKVKLELIATGKDATSLITETPVMITRPPGMPEDNPRGTPPGMAVKPPAAAAAPATGGYGSPAPAPAPATGGYGSPAPAPAPASGGYGK
ncbi:MAG TPA: hypothetical protein VI078_03595 [bacterium]